MSRRHAIWRSAAAVEIETTGLVVGASVVFGLAIAVNAPIIVALVFASALTVLLIKLPLRYMVVALVVVTATVPSVTIAQTPDLSIVLGGTLKGLGLIAAVTAAKCFYLEAHLPRVPSLGIGAVAVAVGAIAISAATGAVRPPLPSPGPPFEVSLGDAVRAIAFILAGMVGFISIATSRTAAERLAIYRALSVVVIGIGLSGIYYWAWLKGFVPAPPGLSTAFDKLRTTSPFSIGARSSFPYAVDSPDVAAVIYVLLASAVLPAIAGTRKTGDKVIVALASLVTLVAVGVTGSRTGVVCLGVALLTAVLINRRTSGLFKAVTIFAVAVLAVIVIPSIFSRASEVSVSNDTFAARVEIWEQAWDDVEARPILGSGFGFSSGNRFLQARSEEGSSTEKLSSVHSQYFEMLVDGGFVGLGLLCLAMGLLIVIATRLVEDPIAGDEGRAFACFLAVLAVASLDSSTLASDACASIIWLVCGLAVGRLAQLETEHALASSDGDQAKGGKAKRLGGALA